MQGYAEGLEYGRKCSVPMSPMRRLDNERMVRESEYVLPSSPTRAYWLGFRRAMREGLPPAIRTSHTRTFA